MLQAPLLLPYFIETSSQKWIAGHRSVRHPFRTRFKNSHGIQDATRLPEGMNRIAYDADTGRYTFRDEKGVLYQGAPGEEYGVMTPVSSPRANLFASGTFSLVLEVYTWYLMNHSKNRQTTPPNCHYHRAKFGADLSLSYDIWRHFAPRPHHFTIPIPRLFVFVVVSSFILVFRQEGVFRLGPQGFFISKDVWRCAESETVADRGSYWKVQRGGWW